MVRVLVQLLVDIVKEQGQRAYVGKVSMDRNSPVRASLCWPAAIALSVTSENEFAPTRPLR